MVVFVEINLGHNKFRKLNVPTTNLGNLTSHNKFMTLDIHTINILSKKIEKNIY